jgi:hypothetical protein
MKVRSFRSWLRLTAVLDYVTDKVPFEFRLSTLFWYASSVQPAGIETRGVAGMVAETLEDRFGYVGMPSFRSPPSGFGMSTRFTGCGL